jgi:nitrite reductase/ring-hydroxylating ferredoxin subunit
MSESGRPPAGTALCRLEEIPDPGARGFDFREGDALWSGFLVLKDGILSAYEDTCPHAGSPIGDMIGRFLTREADYIICSAHGALFRIGDGACVAGPCAGRGLRPWPVEVVDGLVRTA